MFSIEVKFKVNDCEVSAERFAALFLGEVFRATFDDAMTKVTQLPLRAQPPIQWPPAPSTPRAEPRVVPVSEAARLLGLRPSTIWAWIGHRKIASVHLGGRRMIPVEAINELLLKGLVPARETR